MPNPPVKAVSKQEFTKLTNHFGQTGATPRCPGGCDYTYFRSAGSAGTGKAAAKSAKPAASKPSRKSAVAETKTAASAFVCHVCKYEIRGA